MFVINNNVYSTILIFMLCVQVYMLYHLLIFNKQNGTGNRVEHYVIVVVRLSSHVYFNMGLASR